MLIFNYFFLFVLIFVVSLRRFDWRAGIDGTVALSVTSPIFFFYVLIAVIQYWTFSFDFLIPTVSFTFPITTNLHFITCILMNFL